MPIVEGSPSVATDSDELAALARDVTHSQTALYNRSGAVHPWIGYFACDAHKGMARGSCSFVGSPTDGVVEIAYFSFPGFERQGLGRRMAGRLIEIAQSSGEVAEVIAHTLPEDNPSTSILRRLGFIHSGYANDEDAGTVWRWSLTLQR